MSKKLSIVGIILAIALIGYNATMVDLNTLFIGDSLIALIGIAASSCAIILLLIYMTSKKIQKKVNED